MIKSERTKVRIRIRRIAKRVFNRQTSSGRDKYHWFVRRGVLKMDYIKLGDNLMYGPFTFDIVGGLTRD